MNEALEILIMRIGKKYMKASMEVKIKVGKMMCENKAKGEVNI